MERHLRVPALAVIPPIAATSWRRTPLRLPLRAGSANGAGRNGVAGELVAATRVHSVGAEAYRTLRTNLQFSQAVANLRSVVVTSPSGGEGKTTTAANLAVTFAQQGSRVLLVDCDVRRPRVHGVFHRPKEPGLTDVLLGTVSVEEAIQQTTVPGLSIIAAGTLPSVSATDLLSGPVLRSLMTSLGADYELVILDAPPVLVAANAAVLGTAVDGVLLVVRAGQTDPASAQDAIHQLTAVGAHVIGAVLNDPDATLTHKPSVYHDETVTVN
jgi:capsular exopolysaccharide synthesis family protein